MSNIIEILEKHESKYNLRVFRDRYLSAWHPMGYGTTFKPIRKEGDMWVLEGYRFNSCD